MPQMQRSRIVRKQATAQDCPRPQPRSRRILAASPNEQRFVRAVASSWPYRLRLVSQFIFAAFQPMPSFDPVAVRKAVEEFTPRRPQKFQDLVPAKDVITELRQKRASYRSIAELLTEHCLPTSKTAIAVFCHQVLGESVRPRRRPGRKRPSVSAPLNGEEPISEGAARDRGTQVTSHEGGDTPQARTRGPRIAQVRVLKPQTT